MMVAVLLMSELATLQGPLQLHPHLPCISRAPAKSAGEPMQFAEPSRAEQPKTLPRCRCESTYRNPPFPWLVCCPWGKVEGGKKEVNQVKTRIVDTLLIS